MNDFPAVQLLDHRPYDRIREFYLYQETNLIAAMRRGDRGEAMRIINHVLVHIYSAGEERSDLLKGLLLELVVMISRAAIEAGAHVYQQAVDQPKLSARQGDLGLIDFGRMRPADRRRKNTVIPLTIVASFSTVRQASKRTAAELGTADQNPHDCRVFLSQVQGSAADLSQAGLQIHRKFPAHDVFAAV